jgi:transposase
MKSGKRKLLNKKDSKKIDKILQSEKELRIFKRALVLRAIDLGFTQNSIEKLGVFKERTVRNLMSKYSSGGLDYALNDRPRTGQPRKFTRRQEEKITAIACTAPPEGQSRWTLDLIKEVTEKENIVKKISREALRILLASREIKPWRHKMWCIPKVDEEFIRCMEDVLEIYEREYDPREPVVCIDEKPTQLLESCRPDIAGKIIKKDYEYVRKGVVNAFCGIEPKAGKHFLLIRERKTMKDFAVFVRDIIAAYPKAKKIHLVMDNLGTHKEKALIERFGKKEGRRLWKKIVPHYTPKHASWLNQAEIEISMFSRSCLGKNRVGDIGTLRKNAAAWKKRMNRKKVKIDWTFSRRKARVKFKYKTGKN